MRTATLVACMLWIASASADSASCTYTWNSLTKSFVKSCTGNMPLPPLSLEEQVALKQGTVKACVITAEGFGKKAEFRRSCK